MWFWGQSKISMRWVVHSVLPYLSENLKHTGSTCGFLGTRVSLAVALFCNVNPFCYGQVRFVCVFSFFVVAVFPPAAVSCRLESPWLQSAVQRETPGSFIGYGRRIIRSPLSKLLIEGVMSEAAPPRLAGTDAHATQQLKAACVAQIAVFVTSLSVVRVLARLCLWAAPSLTQGFHQALTVDLDRYREFIYPGNGVQGGVCTGLSWVGAFGDTGRGYQIST